MTTADRIEQLARYAARYAAKEREATAAGDTTAVQIWKHHRVNAERVLERLRAVVAAEERDDVRVPRGE